jgi:ubiquinone/menaquinone biosynthesis C-methylase UbiE
VANDARSRAARRFDDPAFVSRYEAWYDGSGQRPARLEKSLLNRLLADLAGASSALEVGCGTGYFTRWLAGQGWQMAGLDLASAMLLEARRRDDASAAPSPGPAYVRGDAQTLPFATGSFDVAVMITSLEFVPDTAGALREAARVARRAMVVIELNPWSLRGLRDRLRRDSVRALAFSASPPALARLVKRAVAPRPVRITWRTTLWPIPGVADLPLPFGGVLGLAARFDAPS